MERKRLDNGLITDRERKGNRKCQRVKSLKLLPIANEEIVSQAVTQIVSTPLIQMEQGKIVSTPLTQMNFLLDNNNKAKTNKENNEDN